MEIYDLSHIVALQIMQKFIALPSLHSEIVITEIENYSSKTSKNPNPKPDHNFLCYIKKPCKIILLKMQMS